MKKMSINQNKTLNLQLRLNKFREKVHEQDKIDNRILLATMSFSILRLILKSYQNEIGNMPKIIWDFFVDVTFCRDSPRTNIHYNEAKLRTCIGTNKTCYSHMS